MVYLLKIYIFFLPLFFFLFFSEGRAQETKKDTISLIISHQKKASEALLILDFNTAKDYLNKANSLAVTTNNNLIKASVNLSIAKFYYNIRDNKKAASSIVESILLLNETEDIYLKAKTNHIYALILIEEKDFETAEYYLKNAERYFSELNDTKNKAFITIAFGDLELERGNINNAIDYYKTALPVFISEKQPYPEAFLYLEIANAYLHLNNYKDTKNLKIIEEYLAKALNIINRNSYPELKTESYKVASQVAILKNQTDKAFTLLNSYSEKKDSVFDIYFKAMANQSRIENKIGNLNKIIETQQDNIIQNQKSISFSKKTTGLSIALIIILSLLAFSLYKNNNLRENTNNLLKKKNIELTITKENLEKASLAKEQFLSTITHELRTPLYAVTGLTHLLLEEDPKPQQKELLNSLKFSGEYLLSIINNILDLAKLEANKTEIETASFNLKKRISNVLISLKQTAEDKNNKLILEYDKNIPDFLMGDPLKISQVLINLIGNSLKFTKNGTIIVRVIKNKQIKNIINVRIEVEDTGIGISKEQQKLIFESFNQGSLRINRKFGGTGLGLSIVKSLLELMNSKIYLESSLGKGTKFWFDISFELPTENTNTENTNTEKSKDEIDYKLFENVSVLIVEDNKINQIITKKILEKHKMICMIANNGMDAIKMVRENNFQIILMDIHMPGISGVETTLRIREFNKDVFIIALTAITIKESVAEFYNAGFNEVIPKPFKIDNFFDKIYHLLIT